MILVWTNKLMPPTKTIRNIIDFWFSPRVKPLRFNSNPAFDKEITDLFLGTYRTATDHGLDHWETTAEGALALVLVLDQFPLHMFRGRNQSFSTERAARKVAERAIAQGMDQLLAPEQQAFLYMPYMHSENIEDQDRGIALYQAAGLKDNLRFAEHHREIIRRFGRFPHRNAILHRESTPEELEYLNSKEAFLG